MGSFTHKVEEVIVTHVLNGLSVGIHDVYLRPRLILRLHMRYPPGGSSGGTNGLKRGLRGVCEYLYLQQCTLYMLVLRQN